MCKGGWAFTPPPLMEGKPLAASKDAERSSSLYLLNTRDCLFFWELPLTLPVLTHYINDESNCPQKMKLRQGEVQTLSRGLCWPYITVSVAHTGVEADTVSNGRKFHPT